MQAGYEQLKTRENLPKEDNVELFNNIQHREAS